MISAAARQKRKEKRDRKRAEFDRTIAQFSLEGRFCANCKHIAAAPFPGKGRICSLNSDSEGYMPVLPTGICTDHAFRADRAPEVTQEKLVTIEARPISEYHEDMGDMLWWRFPIEESPYVGSPNDLGYTVETEVVVRSRTHTDPQGKQRALKFNRDVGGWPGYHTHFTPIPFPATPAQSSKGE